MLTPIIKAYVQHVKDHHLRTHKLHNLNRTSKKLCKKFTVFRKVIPKLWHTIWLKYAATNKSKFSIFCQLDQKDSLQKGLKIRELREIRGKPRSFVGFFGFLCYRKNFLYRKLFIIFFIRLSHVENYIRFIFFCCWLLCGRRKAFGQRWIFLSIFMFFFWEFFSRFRWDNVTDFFSLVCVCNDLLVS